MLAALLIDLGSTHLLDKICMDHSIVLFSGSVSIDNLPSVSEFTQLDTQTDRYTDKVFWISTVSPFISGLTVGLINTDKYLF